MKNIVRQVTAVLAFSPFIVLAAHSYPKLTIIEEAKIYVEAVKKGQFYQINSRYNSLLNEYYKSIRLKNDWDTTDPIFNDPTYYGSVRAFSGEVCALIWRHVNNQPQRSYFHNVELKVPNNSKIEQTPFFLCCQSLVFRKIFPNLYRPN